MFYNVFFLILSLGNLVLYGNFAARRNIYYLLLALLFFLTAFRFEVGCDYYSYQRLQRVFGAADFSEAIFQPEPGFHLMTVILNKVGLEFPWINVFAAMAFYAGIHAIARRQPDPLGYLSLSFPILILQIGMAALRQSMALGFVCFAFNAFVDKNRIKFILWVLVASAFHSSAIALILLTPFMFKSKYKDQIIISIIAAAPVLIYLLSSDVADSYVKTYVNTGVDAAGGSSRALLLAITGVVFMVVLSESWKKLSQSDYDLVSLSAPMLILMLPLALYSSVLGDRFGYYLVPVELIIQTKGYLIIRHHSAALAFIVPYFIVGTALLIQTQYSWIFDSCYVPYSTWWF